ncbi:MAG: hypothetical protein RLO52_22095 [Sandaracinaceae bacterium]|nr:hypothetical protein [Myxococcales bacterium]
MDRKLLADILEKTSGLDKKDGEYLAEGEHRASVYLGATGGTTVLTEIVRLSLQDSYLEAEAKDGTVHYVVYEPVFGLAVRGPRDGGPGSRTGF